jgi:hypothetical protein
MRESDGLPRRGYITKPRVAEVRVREVVFARPSEATLGWDALQS